METIESSKRSYRFTDEKERMKVINRLLTIEVCIFYFLVIAFSVFEMNQGYDKAITLSLITASSVFFIISIVIYFKDKSSKINSYIGLTLFYLTFFGVIVFGDIQLLLFGSIVILTALIQHYNKRLITIYAAVSIIVEIINLVYHILLNNESSVPATTLLGTSVVYISAVFAIFMTTMRSIQFNNDIRGKMEDEKNEQIDMLNDVIHITKVVKKDVDARC
jgi:NO-binding membrane sensor protein with MHYT domain